MKLKLWVQADSADDLDVTVSVCKLDRDGNPALHAQGTGAVSVFQATGFQRASRRRLDPERSTEAEPILLMTDEQRLSPNDIVPLEIGIWPTGMRLHARETLQLTVLPHQPHPIELGFGTAQIALPVDRFTFTPGDDVEMLTLGGGPETAPAWVAEQAIHEPPRNTGTHVLHMGGKYDSHLLIPLRQL